MNIYEMEISKTTYVKMRVRANSEEQAEEIYERFSKAEPEYINEELELNGDSVYCHSEIKEVHPATWDECATITENEDGTFEAQYEGGD